MSALSSMLVQDQVLTVTQIEQALQRQVIFGGDLATNLLELGLVDERVLAEYMGRVARLPVIPDEHLDNIDHRVVKMLPWQVVNDRQVLPVRIHGNSIVVAANGPLPAGALDEISYLLGVDVQPHLALEFRLAMALNRYYGIPMKARMAALQRKLAPDFVRDQQPVVPPPGGEPAAASTPVKAESEPLLVVESSRPPSHDTDSTMKFITVGSGSPRQGEPMTSPLAPRGGSLGARQTADIASRPHRRRAARRIAFSEAMRLIEQVEERDAILDLFLEFAGQAFDYTALFVVHGKVAQVRSAMRRGEAPHDPGFVSVPLDRGGMFDTVFKTRGFHLGPPGAGEVDTELLEQLHRNQPKSCAVIPVNLRQRMILILYGDSGSQGVRSNRVAKIAEFTRSVSAGFERILIKQKYGKYHKRELVAEPKAAPVEPPPPQQTEPDPAGDQLAKWAREYRRSADEQVGKVRLGRLAGPVEGVEMIGAETWPEPSTSIPASVPAPDPAPEPEADDEPPVLELVSEAAREPEASWQQLAEAGEPEAELAPEPVPEAETELEPQPVLSDAPTAEPEPVVRTEPIAIISELSPTEPPDEPPEAPAQVASQRARKPDPQLLARVQVLHIPARPAASEPVIPEALDTPVPDLPATTPTDEPSRDTFEHAETMPAPEAEEPAPAATPEPQPVASVEPPPSRSVVVEMNEEIDRLIERVMSRGTFDQTAAELLVGIGDDALAKLVQHFPGPLNCDRYQDLSRLRKVAQHGPLLKALTMFGERAVPYITPLLDSLDSEVRFYATFLFSEISHPDAVGALVHRIFDNDRQIRAVAMDVIGKCANFPEYRWAMKELADTLISSTSTLETKRIAAEALGELREPVSIKALAEMLGSVDGILAERCHRSLVEITFNDFGFSERRWLSWWHANSGRHRIEWAIDSLNHRAEGIRRSAIEELRRLVGGVVEWPSGPLDHKQRKELKRLLEEWWKREGRLLHPVMELD